MLERCEIRETQHALDRTGYQCSEEACVHCFDCGNSVCAKHGKVCELCLTVFCTPCLKIHSHPKVVSVESKRDRRKIA